MHARPVGLTSRALVIALVVSALSMLSWTVEPPLAPAAKGQPAPSAVAAPPGAPHVFFYNLDDLRDALPGQVDPLSFMPKAKAWMADGRRYTQTTVGVPSCCPSRAALMTGRYPHNNGVLRQSQGPLFDGAHSLACYLQAGGYTTYIAGKFLTTWPRTTVPPCYTHSTVMWGGYTDVAVRVDGVSQTASGYSTTYLGNRGRSYITAALDAGQTFYLYEPPQAPHWVQVTRPDGVQDRLAVPEPTYASAPVGSCAGPPEADRSDKPAYVRRTNETTADAQLMCESQLRAIMSADDQFDATMRLLQSRGVLDNTLVILSSDNGYNWGEHGRTEKFVPYEPSIRVPLLVRWPGHIPAGVDTSRVVSYLDIMPTVLQAAGFVLPASAPRLDGESLLAASSRTTGYSEYHLDTDNGNVNTWKAARTRSWKYIETYNESGGVVFREYYNLTSDPHEANNLLVDPYPNTPPATQLSRAQTLLGQLTSCSGSGCIR